MQQHSILEPFHSLLQAPADMEASSKSYLPAFKAVPPPSLFSISPPSQPSSSFLSFYGGVNSSSSSVEAISCDLLHAQAFPSSSWQLDIGTDYTETPQPPSLGHPELSPSSNSSTFLTPIPPHGVAPSDEDNYRKPCTDDGSVGCKLLASITKSKSSPSLHVPSFKEAVRETTYAKALKLKQMKLQHCAEELGRESSDGSPVSFHGYHCTNLHDQKSRGTAGNLSCCPQSFKLHSSHQHHTTSSHQQQSHLNSVRSAPSLNTQYSRYSRSSSFPPPLSHTLPASSSHDSFCLSLRAYREDGRFILKETMVPRKHYLQARRKNGRLTLHLFTRAEEEEEHFDSKDDISVEESKCEGCHKGHPSEKEEEKIFGSMVSSYGATQKAVVSKKEVATARCEARQEVYLVKLSLKADHITEGKESIEGNQSLDMASQSSSFMASFNSTDQHVPDKRDILSNVITLSLQASTPSKLTTRHSRAQVCSFPDISSYSLVPAAGSLRTSPTIHSLDLERKHGFQSIESNPQSKGKLFWESMLMPASRTVGESGGPLHALLTSDRGKQPGVMPALVSMEEVKKESLVQAEPSLVLGAASYGGREIWWHAETKKALPTVLVSGTEHGAGNAGSIPMSGKMMNDEGAAFSHGGGTVNGKEPVFSHWAKFGYVSINGEEEASAEGGMAVLQSASSSSTLDLQLSFSRTSEVLPCEEWLHPLHCKKLFDMHQLCQGFHCIPSRS